MRRYLFIGLLIYFSGVIISVILPVGHSINDEFLEKFSKLPDFARLFVLIIFAPILEEVSFRSWVVKTKFRKLFAALGIVSFVLLTFKLAWAVVIILLFSIFLFGLPSKKLEEESALLFSSSILFGLVHLPNYALFINAVGPVVQLFGLGILFGFFGLRYGFLYSVLTHITYNILVFLFLSSSLLGKEYTLSMQGKEIYIEEVSIFRSEPSFMLINKEEGFLKGSKTEIIKSLLPKHDTVRYLESSFDFTRLVLQSSTPKFGEDRKIAMKLIELWQVKLDTSHVDCYSLEITEPKELNCENCSFQTELIDFKDYIELKFGVPVVIANDSIRKELDVKISFLEIKKLSEAVVILRRDYGIVLQKMDDCQISIVQLSL